MADEPPVRRKSVQEKLRDVEKARERVEAMQPPRDESKPAPPANIYDVFNAFRLVGEWFKDFITPRPEQRAQSEGVVEADAEENRDKEDSNPHVTKVANTDAVRSASLADSIEPVQDKAKSWQYRLVDWLVRTKTPRQEGETFAGKFDRLSESNLFWGGGVGIVSLALAFRFSDAPHWFSLTLLIIGWLIISISIWRHKFFEGQARLIQTIANTFVCVVIAAVISVAWFVLSPKTQQPVEKERQVQVSPTPPATTTPTAMPSPVERLQTQQPISIESKRTGAASPINMATAQPTAQPSRTIGSEPPAPHVSQVASVFPSVREGLPYGFRIVLQTTVTISPVQVLVQCSGPIEEATNIVIGASAKLGSGGAPRGKDYYSFRIDAPPFTPQSPIQIDLFSKTKVTCRVVRVD